MIEMSTFWNDKKQHVQKEIWLIDENLHKSFESLILVSFVKFLNYKNNESIMLFWGIFATEALFTFNFLNVF